MFFSLALCFLAKQFQLHRLYSRKNGEVVRAPKEVHHELKFFWSYSMMKFVEQSS